MVVQETATSTGKGASKATAKTVSAAIAGALMAISAQAQIVGAPNVPGNLRPTVLTAPNGVPLVNVQTPSAAGVSRNVYNQFSVGANGAILNNSRVNVQTQLGGFVQGNPNLATGSARIILNEVNGGTPSQLRGYIEVGGQRAEVIIANPAGISVDGGGFINASRATLTTGTPQFNAVGGLDSFLVRGGTVTIDGAGLDASKTDYAAILARAVQANASIWASELKVVTGANQISADHTQVTPTAGTGSAPTFALDVAALGGMYANKIVLIGSEAGLGVRNAGNIGASAGGLVVTAAGRLENIGTLEGQRVELTTPGDISNRGGTIRQASLAGLTIASPVLSNANGGMIGAEPVTTGASSGGTSSGGSGTTNTTTGNGTTTPSTTGGSGTGSSSTSAPTTYSPPAPGAITAGGTISNDGGKIYAGGPIALNTPQINNAGGSLNVATMSVAGPSFSNAGGTLNVSQSFGANVGSFDNTGGKLNAGSLSITTVGDLLNIDGTLTSASNVDLAVGGNGDNTRGTISATGALTASFAGAVQNTSGTLASNQNLNVAAQSLNNSQGNISSAGSNVQLTIGQQLLNTAGRIASGANLSVQTGSLDGSGGNLQSTGDMAVAANQALTSTGTNVAGGDAAFKGASVDLSGSQTGAANIAITAVQGSVTTSGATVATPGTLAITANAQPGQALVNNAGQLNAAQLQINASNIANINGGQIVQTGTAATVLAVSGSIDNSNSHIATNGQDLTLQAASITNNAGKIDHAGTGTLTIAGGSFNGANGAITGNGALIVNLSGAFNQDAGTTYAKQIDITAASLSNQSGGSIVQAGAGTTTLNVGGALSNNAGTIASNGAIIANAGSTTNRGGKLQAAESSDLSLTVVGQLDNSAAGKIASGGNTNVSAGSLKNDTGSLTAVGNLDLVVSNAATNVGGMLAANGNTTLAAASLDNSAGTTAAVSGDLKVTTAGTTTNTGGTLQAGGTATLSNGGLSGAGGKIFGNSLSIDTHGGALDNSAKGTIAATTTVDIKSGAINNDTGLIQSGAAMAIDTNGQALTNRNAAGYTNGQGGITSADTLTLSAGTVNSSAGFIGAKGALTASTQGFSNTSLGQVIGQAAVSINTHGATYDNSGGQTQSVGALTVNAGSIQNAAGLLRSSDTTTLNAGTVNNANSSGVDQGIEGTNVAITATNLGNRTGAVRAARNLTVTGGGTIDNSTGGLLSAGDTLKLADTNAANPNAKTLTVVNTGGTLVASNSLQIDAANFSNDGSFTSGRDMSVALTQDIVNNRDVSVSGNLTYGTTGHLTNNAKLLAGDTLTVSGNVVDNTATGEMSGTNTIVNASTLNNRGLIDSQGNTQANAGTLNNIGTGRIYGNAVSISAASLLNDAETAGGITSAGTIASRGDLHIGAGSVTNREHALIFSAANMAIAGALDASRRASGQGETLDNLSAEIQSLGDLSLSMAQVNNRDTHIQLGQPTVTHSVLQGIQPKTLVGSGVGRANLYLLSEVTLDPANGVVYLVDTGELVGIGGYSFWTNNLTTTTDTAVNADPGRLVAGGNMTVNGQLYNQDSQVTAGGSISASGYQSSQLTGSVNVTGLASAVSNQGQVEAVNIPLFVAPQSIALGAYKYEQNLNSATGFNTGNAAKGSSSAIGGAVGSASGSSQSGAIVEVAANVGIVAGVGGAGAGAASAAGGGSASTVPAAVRTTTPNLSVPQASLYRMQAAGRYLIETDPRFANYRTWLSSDYLLGQLGFDPNSTLKRLGDGFYEQQLIREQVAKLTGYRYLEGFSSDEDQYAGLMNAGATFGKQYGLVPGVVLTAAQMAQLTSDIVWLVEQTVTLPDGSSQKVLVPQVYVRVRPGDIDGSGALLSADSTVIKSTGDVTNKGTIAGRSLVSITADNVNNLDGGRILGGSIGIDAATDINNIGSSITAREKLSLEAGRDINVRSTTTSAALGNTAVDRVAGLYVTDPGGILVASAGRDVKLIGAIVNNAGSGKTSITAKNDINLGAVSTTTAIFAIGQNFSGGLIHNQEVGTRLSSGGDLILDAGNDFKARQANVSAGGNLGVKAGNDILIESGRDQLALAFEVDRKSKGFLKSTNENLSGQVLIDMAVGSTFSGSNVLMDAGRDLNVVGSDIIAQGDATLKAGRNVNIVSALQESSATADRSRTTSGLIVPKPTDHNWDVKRNNSDHAELKTQTERASSIAAGQNLQVSAGEQVNIFASNLSAGADLGIIGKEITVLSGTNYTGITQGSSSDRETVFVTGSPVRTGHGGGNANSVTSSSESTTLAAATLSGRNVTITATDGDLTLGAAHINAAEAVDLNAPKGAINFDTVTTGVSTTQERGEHDWAYQRSRESGSLTTSANYTQINSASVSANAQSVNVQVGRSATGGKDGPLQYSQSVQQALQQQSGQPGMSWLDQIQKEPKLANIPINWQSVPLAQRHWADGQGGLTETGGAVITIVASVFSYGAASGWGAAASQAAGGGAFGSAVGVAVQAGIASIASQAAVGIINHNGDLGAVLDDLMSSQGIKRIVTSMATAGVVQGINVGLGIDGWTAGSAAAGTATWTQVLGRNILNGAASGLVYAGINGTSVEQALRDGLLDGLLNTAASGSAQWIGGNTEGFANAVAHALAGCVVGAGRAGGGFGLSGGDGCSAGAIGATVGHLAGQFYNPTDNPDLAAQTIQFGQMMAGVAGALVGGNQASADIAAAAGSNALANNTFGQVARAVGALCARFPAVCVGAAGAAALQAQMSAKVAELQAANPSLSVDNALMIAQSEILGRALVGVAQSFIGNLPTAADYGNAGYGANGIPYYGPANTGNTTTLPDYGTTTGGNQIINLDSTGHFIGGGYGAGGTPSYGGPTITPDNGIIGATLALAQAKNIWNLKPTDRGILIEANLAQTEYKDWFNIGQLNRGTFPLVDFQNGNTLVSLKTVDTRGATWPERLEQHIEDLGSNGATVNGKRANMVLDVRVQPGGGSSAQYLIEFGRQNNVTVIIKEY